MCFSWSELLKYLQWKEKSFHYELHYEFLAQSCQFTVARKEGYLKIKGKGVHFVRHNPCLRSEFTEKGAFHLPVTLSSPEWREHVGINMKINAIAYENT